MEIGIGLTTAEHVADKARRAEALGFDSVHCGEHLFFHGPTPNAFVALSVAAGATTRIGLLSAVVLLPLYPAALVAKMASVLDVASGGRFRLGVGLGGEFPPEFAAVGVPVSERGRRADEALDVITRLFTDPIVRYEGRWSSLDGVALQPPPATRGGPPIWIAGRRRTAQRRAGRWGAVWMPYMCTPEHVADGLTTVRESAALHGRAPDDVRASLYAFVTVDRDGGRARRVAAETVGRSYRQDFSRLQHYLVAGTPGECAARLREYRDAGAAAAQLTLACDAAEEPAMVRLLAEEVVPELR